MVYSEPVLSILTLESVQSRDPIPGTGAVVAFLTSSIIRGAVTAGAINMIASTFSGASKYACKATRLPAECLPELPPPFHKYTLDDGTMPFANAKNYKNF